MLLILVSGVKQCVKLMFRVLDSVTTEAVLSWLEFFMGKKKYKPGLNAI